MSDAVHEGVVLTAGRGSRLHPLSVVYPKPLHPVCNKPIIQYQLEMMCRAGIKMVTIVIGPNGEPIRRYFSDGRWLGLEINYVEDEAPTGIASSLALAESRVTGPIAVFLGDIFLAVDDLTPALAPIEAGAAGTILVRRDTPDAVRRNFAVLTEPDGRVARVIEKPAEPPTDLKGCGVYVFDGSIFDAIRKTPRSPLRNEYEITDAVQIMLDMATHRGRSIYAVDIVRWDVNVTYPEDLLRCNMRLLREQQLDSLIGQGARISNEARVFSSVVGDRAVIDGAFTLQDCLVFPDTEVTSPSELLRQQIFADGIVWSAPGDVLSAP